MKPGFHFIIISIFSFIVLSCSKQYTISNKQTSQTRIKADSLHLYDSATHYFIAPYKTYLDSQMNIVAGTTLTTLIKEKPEGTLGSMMADATMWYAAKHYEKPVDVCVLNYGGIRLPSIQAGNITIGKLYELMPFDNQVEILEISGQTLNEFLQMVAASEGWPVSGIRMTIQDRKAIDIMIGNTPLDLGKTYILVTSDYVANGGDNAGMLKTYSKRTSLNYKLRDAIIDYVKSTGQLNLIKDGRITLKP